MTATNPLDGRWLGQMGHSGDFARWPHLGPIRPMARGGHLGPLSYVYGYRGGVGRSGVGQDTTREDDIEIRARDGRYELILWRCMAVFVPKSAISEMGRCLADVGQRENGRSVELASPLRDAPGRS